MYFGKDFIENKTVVRNYCGPRKEFYNLLWR